LASHMRFFSFKTAKQLSLTCCSFTNAPHVGVIEWPRLTHTATVHAAPSRSALHLALLRHPIYPWRRMQTKISVWRVFVPGYRNSAKKRNY